MSAKVEKYRKKGIGLGEAQGNWGFSFYVVPGKKQAPTLTSFLVKNGEILEARYLIQGN